MPSIAFPLCPPVLTSTQYIAIFLHYCPVNEKMLRPDSGRSFRTASRWSQFVTLALAQLTDRMSLRDIVDNVSAQAHRFYHLGSAKLTRSNLSRINEDKPYAFVWSANWEIAESLPRHGVWSPFLFENSFYCVVLRHAIITFVIFRGLYWKVNGTVAVFSHLSEWRDFIDDLSLNCQVPQI